MIGSLRGTLADRLAAGEIIVEVAGVGYRVSVPTVAPGLGRADRAARCSSTSTPTCGRTPSSSTASPTPTSGDASRRCSAPTASDPSLALGILSSLSPAALSTAVLEDDLDTLCTVPGVGKKTAARLLLELKARLDLPSLDPAGQPGPSSGGAPRAEARAALAELGYGPDEIRAVLDVVDDTGSVEDLVRTALRELARSR